MQPKLASILFCLIIYLSTLSQSPYKTIGNYTFWEQIHFGDTVILSPGQLNKKGDKLYIGLNFESDTGYQYDIYRFNLVDKIAPLYVHSKTPFREIMQPTVTYDEKIMIVTVNMFKGWAGNNLIECIVGSNGNVTSVRVMDELNTEESSEAYPWISGDGLHIYFTRDEKIFYSKRSNTRDSFEKPTELQFNGITNLAVLSCWLSANEKNIFIVSENIVYKAKRKNRKAQFDLPIVHTAEFKDFDFIAGVSFTPNLKDLYLYNSDNSESILHYKLK